MMRSTFAIASAAAFAIAVLAWATDSFRALTTDQARRAAVAARPLPVPNLELTMASGDIVLLRELVSAHPRNLIVGFFYSDCRSICVTLAHEFNQLQKLIVERNLAEQVGLLSISFDRDGDTPSRLQDYARRMSADPGVWHVGTVTHAKELPGLLKTFGIRVISDGRGGYIHNSAFHIVNREGELTRIFDLAEPQSALRVAAN